MKYEGGFQGRTNKLVDGCYSFWQGGVFPLIHMILSMEGMYMILSMEGMYMILSVEGMYLTLSSLSF